MKTEITVSGAAANAAYTLLGMAIAMSAEALPEVTKKAQEFLDALGEADRIVIEYSEE